MGSNRIVYQNWIVALGRDPDEFKRDLRSHLTSHELNSAGGEISRETETRVREAIGHLTEKEQEFVRQFYFMGKTYRELSEVTGQTIHKLEALHRRVIRKLRRQLADFVSERFGVSLDATSKCVICSSPNVGEIDRIIAERDKRTTWKPVITILRERFGMKIRSPQVLSGHEKYHMQKVVSGVSA